jgi:hypothetical protein
MRTAFVTISCLIALGCTRDPQVLTEAEYAAAKERIRELQDQIALSGESREMKAGASVVIVIDLGNACEIKRAADGELAAAQWYRAELERVTVGELFERHRQNMEARAELPKVQKLAQQLKDRINAAAMSNSTKGRAVWELRKVRSEFSARYKQFNPGKLAALKWYRAELESLTVDELVERSKQ